MVVSTSLQVYEILDLPFLYFVTPIFTTCTLLVAQVIIFYDSLYDCYLFRHIYNIKASRPTVDFF